METSFEHDRVVAGAQPCDAVLDDIADLVLDPEDDGSRKKHEQSLLPSEFPEHDSEYDDVYHGSRESVRQEYPECVTGRAVQAVDGKRNCSI